MSDERRTYTLMVEGVPIPTLPADHAPMLTEKIVVTVGDRVSTV